MIVIGIASISRQMILHVFTAPSLASIGWFGGTIYGTSWHFQGARNNAPRRADQFLINGPYAQSNAPDGDYEYQTGKAMKAVMTFLFLTTHFTRRQYEASILSLMFERWPSNPVRNDMGRKAIGLPISINPYFYRNDVLVCTNEPFNKSIIVIGDIIVVLIISSTVRDTDFLIEVMNVMTDRRYVKLRSKAARQLRAKPSYSISDYE